MSKVKSFIALSPQQLEDKINKWVDENPGSFICNINLFENSKGMYIALVTFQKMDELMNNLKEGYCSHE